MSSDEFDEILTLIEKGEATEAEMRDCLVYCAGTVLETGRVFRALVKGYAAHLAALTRKEAKLRAAIEFTKRGLKE